MIKKTLWYLYLYMVYFSILLFSLSFFFVPVTYLGQGSWVAGQVFIRILVVSGISGLVYVLLRYWLDKGDGHGA